MRSHRLTAAILLLAAAPALADGGSPSRESLLAGLGAETAAERIEAQRSLEKAEGLTDDEVRAALKSARRLAKPALLRVVAARRMTGLVPDVAALLKAEDPLVTDAAARALVSIGEEAAAAGVASLAGATGDAAVVRRHLVALAAQRTIEREVVGKWKRKGGTYEGRFAVIARHGWPVQPVLLAMLLDVPLSDHHIVLPDTTDEYELRALRMSALADIARSDRRGYRTFDPLPVQIEQEELFDLAVQALKDVGDLDLVGDILERVAEDLEAVDELYGWRLRPWEENFYREIDVSLFARGRPERLVRHKERCQERVENSMAWLSRAEEVGKGADQKQQINNALSEYASVLHQLHEYDEAAACFAQVLKYSKELSGKESAIAGYNRACALNRGGRKDEALRQLDRSLDRSWSSGTEDLTREWVTEDGDLASLHDDPRYKAIIQRRFDDAAGEGRPPAAAPKPKDAPK